MHSKVYQVSLTPDVEPIRELPDWFLNYADYYDEKKVEEDKLLMKKDELEKELKENFDRFKELSKALNYEEFCKVLSFDISDIQMTLDDKYETWFYYEDELYTKKNFMRIMLRELTNKSIEETIMYVINVFDYHW